MNGEELDDELIIFDSRDATSEAIIFQPYVKVRTAVVLDNVGWCPHLRRKLCIVVCAPEGVWPQPRWARATLVPPFARLLNLLLLPMLVVEDVPCVVDTPEAILQGNAEREMCP